MKQKATQGRVAFVFNHEDTKELKGLTENVHCTVSPKSDELTVESANKVFIGAFGGRMPEAGRSGRCPTDGEGNSTLSRALHIIPFRT